MFQGSGDVVVIDATEWEYETHMRHAKDRVVSIKTLTQQIVEYIR